MDVSRKETTGVRDLKLQESRGEERLGRGQTTAGSREEIENLKENKLTKTGKAQQITGKGQCQLHARDRRMGRMGGLVCTGRRRRRSWERNRRVYGRGGPCIQEWLREYLCVQRRGLSVYGDTQHFLTYNILTQLLP